jgi:hypothetical protein
MKREYFMVRPQKRLEIGQLVRAIGIVRICRRAVWDKVWRSISPSVFVSRMPYRAVIELFDSPDAINAYV